ncbi:MAG: hypothetical protein [Bacteriophage sp.]|nr:MAG: hypothetical protein [Bacteriophage sp.]
MIMAIIMHPLTAKNGSPEYTADDYRHAINPLLVPSDGTAFNGLSGIRYGSPSPLVTVSGLTVTVKPHCGTISPWDGLGAYTYAITTNTTVQLADSTNSYKIAVTVEDPSQSHGTTPRGKVEVFTAGTPDSNINGLVIANVKAGVASDAAPMIRNNAILMARNLEQLNTIAAMDGQEAVTIADNVHYVRNGGTWKLKRKTITFGSVGKNTVVGTVSNVGNISHAYGMVLLGSGSTVPLTFFHPDYPNRAASFSITASGQIYILYGSENTLQRGRITICWEY